MLAKRLIGTMQVWFLIVAIASLSKSATGNSVVDLVTNLLRCERSLEDTETRLNETVTRLVEAETRLVETEKSLMDTQTQLREYERNASNKLLCETPECTDWSGWSKCHIDFKGQLANSTRSRECEFNNDPICESFIIDEANRTQTDSKLCDVTNITCPTLFTRTKHGFCLAYNQRQLTNSQAETACEGAGGHLVRLNSLVKSKDMDELIATKAIAHYPHVWINGHSSGSRSSWRYTYGNSTGFYNWDDDAGYPKSDYRFECMVAEYHWSWSLRRWRNAECTDRRWSVCEHM